MYSLDTKTLKIICNEKILFFQELRDRLGLFILLYKIKDVSSPSPPNQKEAKSIFDSMANKNGQTRENEPFKKYKDLLTHINRSSEQTIDLVDMTMWESFGKMVDQCCLMIKIYSSLTSFADKIDTGIIKQIEDMSFMVACKAHEHIGYWTAKKEEQYKNITCGNQKKKDISKRNFEVLKALLKAKNFNLATISKRDLGKIKSTTSKEFKVSVRTIENYIKAIKAETIIA